MAMLFVSDIEKLFLMLILVSNLFIFNGLAQESYTGVRQSWATNTNKSTVGLYEFSANIPRDVIKAIDKAEFLHRRVGERKYASDEPVVVVKIKNTEKAYPLSVLTYHQVINDFVAGTAISVTYCPLTGAVIVYNRRLMHNGVQRQLDLAVSGMLRKANTVLWDRQTETWWQQLTGAGLVGDLAGNVLEVIPSIQLTIKQFYLYYPYGLIFSPDGLMGTFYGTNPYYRYESQQNDKPALFDRQPDSRLHATERVVQLFTGGKQLVYPFSLLQKDGLINDSPNGNYVVVFFQDSLPSALDKREIKSSKLVGSAIVFSSNHNNQHLTFKKIAGGFQDNETSSIWTATGYCKSGKLEGQQLTLLDGRSCFAFAALAFYPESEIYQPK